MPAITPIGWLHTVLGIIALLSGAFTLWKYKEILLRTRSGQIYLAATVVTAVTALAIFQRGTFGPGHALAVATLLALAVGTVAATTQLFGGWARYLQAVSFSATLLFHCIPAITDGLLRLPVGDPVLDSLDDPVLLVCYAVLFAIYLAGITLQLRWIRRTTAGG